MLNVYSAITYNCVEISLDCECFDVAPSSKQAFGKSNDGVYVAYGIAVDWLMEAGRTAHVVLLILCSSC